MAAAQDSKAQQWTKDGKVVLIDRGASSGDDVPALPLKLGNLKVWALCRTAGPRARWCRPCVAPHQVYYAIDAAAAAFEVPTASLLARLSKDYGSSKFERDVDFFVVTAITGRSAPTASVQASGQHSGRLRYGNMARRGVPPFFERDTASRRRYFSRKSCSAASPPGRSSRPTPRPTPRSSRRRKRPFAGLGSGAARRICPRRRGARWTASGTRPRRYHLIGRSRGPRRSCSRGASRGASTTRRRTRN